MPSRLKAVLRSAWIPAGLAVGSQAMTAMSWIGIPHVETEHDRVVLLLIWNALFFIFAFWAFGVLYLENAKLKKSVADADERYKPRPILVPTLKKTFAECEIDPMGKPTSLPLDNHGEEDAINIRVSNIELTEHSIRFDAHQQPVRGKTGGCELFPIVGLKKAGVVKRGQSFEGAFFYEGANYLPSYSHKEWSFTVEYDDLHGRHFETDAVVRWDHPTRTISADFVAARLVKR